LPVLVSPNMTTYVGVLRQSTMCEQTDEKHEVVSTLVMLQHGAAKKCFFF
jgi:hypothetical protein